MREPDKPQRCTLCGGWWEPPVQILDNAVADLAIALVHCNDPQDLERLRQRLTQVLQQKAQECVDYAIARSEAPYPCRCREQGPSALI